MNSTKVVTFSTDKDKLYLLPWGDVHWGHPTCDREKALGYLEWAGENDAQIILMGDLIENSTRESVGAGVYEQIANPDKQIDEVIQALEPYSHLILGALTGNHEERTFKQSGVDPSKYISRVLRVPYLRYAGFLRLVVGGTGYTVYAVHGASGASSSAGKLNAIKRLSSVAEADVYLMGHVHDLSVETSLRQVLDTRNKVVRERRRHFVITGNFLKYEDSYGQMKCYEPAKVGAPRIRFSSKDGDVHVSV
jgi:predicted phosphodiesterase